MIRGAKRAIDLYLINLDFLNHLESIGSRLFTMLVLVILFDPEHLVKMGFLVRLHFKKNNVNKNSQYRKRKGLYVFL